MSKIGTEIIVGQIFKPIVTTFTYDELQNYRDNNISIGINNALIFSIPQQGLDNDSSVDAYDEKYDYSEECHYRIDYKDVYYVIKLMNKQKTVSAHYDKFAKKIYVTHNDTGETTEIDMVKYKVIN